MPKSANILKHKKLRGGGVGKSLLFAGVPSVLSCDSFDSRQPFYNSDKTFLDFSGRILLSEGDSLSHVRQGVIRLHQRSQIYFINIC